MAMLRGSAPAGCASAWALNWLNDGQMKDKAWRPSTIDREPMITLVSDPAADVGAVRFLAFILGRDHDARAVEPLLARLDDPTPEVCEAVAWALGQLSDARAVEPLLAHLDDPAPEVRRTVAGALGRLSDAR